MRRRTLTTPKLREQRGQASLLQEHGDRPGQARASGSPEHRPPKGLVGSPGRRRVGHDLAFQGVHINYCRLEAIAIRFLICFIVLFVYKKSFVLVSLGIHIPSEPGGTVGHRNRAGDRLASLI